MAEIVSLNVALPARVGYDGELFTGGDKRPVSEAMLRFGNFDGDGQADLRNHGGVEKAVCVYPFDHYPHWEGVLGRSLAPGVFSENLTVSGVRETEVFIGDVFEAGEEAVVQVCQPRTPCEKLTRRLGERRIVRWMAETGYTGFYLRVLSEGVVRSGDAFRRVEEHPGRISVADTNDVIHGRKARDAGLIGRLANLPEFSAVGRGLFAERLGRL